MNGFHHLEPYVGDKGLRNVMQAMKCIHCQAEQLSKTGTAEDIGATASKTAANSL
jgi:hypothetical protein